LERIAAAEQIAAKYNHKTIACCVSHEIWIECIKKVHATQVQTQLTVLQYCIYVMAQAGSRNCS
jgi:predicted nucleic acid-binding protein